MTMEAISNKFISSMLKPYFRKCKYLQKAYLDNEEPNKALGKFSISKSFYTESSGHLNAIEFLICFNQLAFVLFGELIRRGLGAEAGFGSLDDFKSDQLSGAYIAGIRNMSFNSPIDPKDFEGTIQISRKNNFYIAQATFKDNKGGRASGRILLGGRKLDNQEQSPIT